MFLPFHKFEIIKLESSTTAATSSRATTSSSRLFIKDPLTKIQFLVDTGADVSVIPYKPDFQPTQPQQQLSAANGSKINVYGTKLLRLGLGLRRNFDHVFLQATVTKPIIGADFLKKYGLMVDLQGQRLVDSTTNLEANAILINDPSPTPKHFAIESDFESLLKEFPELTSEPRYDEEVKHTVVHHIVTNDHLPNSKQRRLNPEKFKAAKTEFDYMCSVGICRPSASPYSSPLHMVFR